MWRPIRISKRVRKKPCSNADKEDHSFLPVERTISPIQSEEAGECGAPGIAPFGPPQGVFVGCTGLYLSFSDAARTSECSLRLFALDPSSQLLSFSYLSHDDLSRPT